MPCHTEHMHAYCKHDSDDFEDFKCNNKKIFEKIERDFSNIVDNLKDKLNYYIKKSDESTCLLCEILKITEEEKMLHHYPERFITWWEDHKRFDKTKEK